MGNSQKMKLYENGVRGPQGPTTTLQDYFSAYNFSTGSTDFVSGNPITYTNQDSGVGGTIAHGNNTSAFILLKFFLVECLKLVKR